MSNNYNSEPPPVEQPPAGWTWPGTIEYLAMKRFDAYLGGHSNYRGQPVELAAKINGKDPVEVELEVETCFQKYLGGAPRALPWTSETKV